MRVNTGSDIQSNVMGNPAANGTGIYAPATWMALSSNAAAPVSTDTTLAGEFAAAGGGLLAKQAAYAHNAGASSYVQSASWTMNANDGASAQVNKFATRQAAAATSTNMLFETAMPTPPTLTPGDALALSNTVNI